MTTVTPPVILNPNNLNNQIPGTPKGSYVAPTVPAASSATSVMPLNYAGLAKTYNIANYTGTPAQQAYINQIYNSGGQPSLVNPKTISGGAQVSVNGNTTSAITAATKNLPTSTSNIQTQVDPNTGVITLPNGNKYNADGTPYTAPLPTTPTVQSDGSTLLPSGAILKADGTLVPAPSSPSAPTVVSTTAPDSTGGTYSTLSNGTTVYNPPNPGTSSLYGQANTASTQETTSYNDQVNSATTQYNQELAQLKLQQKQATDAANASYDTNNPEGSGSDKSEYLSSVAQPFITAINNLNANHALNLTQLGDTHTANLQNIQEQLTTGINTYNTNLYTTAQATLADVKKGATQLTPDDINTLTSQLIQSGQYTPQSAKLAVQEAIQVGNILNDKTQNTETQKNATLAAGELKTTIATAGSVEALANDPVAQNLALTAQVAGPPASYTADGTPTYTAAQISAVKAYLLNQTIPSTKAQDAETNALTRLAISLKNANTNAERLTNTELQDGIKGYLSINKDAFNVQTPEQLINTISGLADYTGAPMSQIQGYVQGLAGTNPNVQKIVSAPGFWSKIAGGSTTTDTNVSSSGGSSNSTNVPAGSIIEYQGKQYSVDASGNMTPI